MFTSWDVFESSQYVTSWKKCISLSLLYFPPRTIFCRRDVNRKFIVIIFEKIWNIISLNITGKIGSERLSGHLVLFGLWRNSIPKNWLSCDSSVLGRLQNTHGTAGSIEVDNEQNITIHCKHMQGLKSNTPVMGRITLLIVYPSNKIRLISETFFSMKLFKWC